MTMERKNQHYYTPSPDVNLKIHTVAESLRRHLYIFKTVTGVFSYRKIDLGTKILIENMSIPMGESDLLDLGCGYGPIGIVLAYESSKSKVHLIDINKRAIWCARENVKVNVANYKGRIKILSSNFFEDIKNNNLKFDGIFMNPPVRIGRKKFFKICNEVPNHLKSSGFFQFVIRKKLGAEFVFNRLNEMFPEQKIEIVVKRSGYWVFKCFHSE